MSLLQYTITNQSAIAKIFLYFSASAYHNIGVGGFNTIVFEADNAFPPTQVPTGVPEDDFVSDSYYPTKVDQLGYGIMVKKVTIY